MQFKTNNIDIEAIKFSGISKPYQRRLAFFATCLVFAIVVYGLIGLNRLHQSSNYFESIDLVAVIVIALYGVLYRRFLLKDMASLLYKATPLSVLYKQDKAIVEKSKKECLDFAESAQLEHYLEYAKYNPLIKQRWAVDVMANQNKGTLTDWVKAVRNHKQLANLVYQIYLVEELLQEDMRKAEV